MRHRQFTLEEANELVPWLEATFQRLIQAQEELTTLQSRLLVLQRQRRSNGASAAKAKLLGYRKSRTG